MSPKFENFVVNKKSGYGKLNTALLQLVGCCKLLNIGTLSLIIAVTFDYLRYTGLHNLANTKVLLKVHKSIA